MDGKDGHWLKSDREKKNSTWSNAMEYITKNNKKRRLNRYKLGVDKRNIFKAYVVQDEYAFDIVRDYYNWIQHQIDEKGYSTQWAKGASYLVDELAETYQKGVTSGGMFPKLGKLLNELNQDIADFAVERFKEVLYDKDLPEDTKKGWYEWDVDFVRDEQIDVVAPGVYKRYEGKKELDLMNQIARKEGVRGTAADLLADNFIPSFATFGFSINKRVSTDSWSNNFGALGRFHLPLLMLYPFTHSPKVDKKLNEAELNEIFKANKAILEYYNKKMKY